MAVFFKDWNVKVARFNGMVDLYNFINENESKKDWATIRRNKERDSWSGGKTYKEAKEQIIYGDSDYTQYFIDGLKTINKENDDNSGIGFDVEGSSYDMGAVIDGVPECCIKQDVLTQRKFIKIVVTTNFSWRVNENYIKNRGIAIFNLINTLILQGYIIELSFIGCFTHCHSDKKDADCGNTDKNALMIIDIPDCQNCVSTIAYLCSVQFFRIIEILVADMITGDYGCDGNNTGYKGYELRKKLQSGEYLYFPDGYDKEDFEGYSYNTVENANKEVVKIFNEYCEKNRKN